MPRFDEALCLRVTTYEGEEHGLDIQGLGKTPRIDKGIENFSFSPTLRPWHFLKERGDGLEC
jgi:hypothetical protein